MKRIGITWFFHSSTQYGFLTYSMPTTQTHYINTICETAVWADYVLCSERDTNLNSHYNTEVSNYSLCQNPDFPPINKKL